MNIKKLLFLLFAGFLLLVAVAAFALTRDYDSPELGQALLARVSESGGMDLQAEGFLLNPLRGLKLEKVTVVSELPGARVTASAEELLLEHRLGPLLSGEVAVDQIVLEQPVVEMVSEALPEESTGTSPGSGSPNADSSDGAGTDASESAAAADDEGLGLVLNITRFAIVDGTVTLRTEGVPEETTEIQGLDLELRDIRMDPGAASPLQGLVAAGDLTADVMTSGTVRAEDVRGDVRLEDGHMRFSKLELPTPQGLLAISDLDVDLNVDPYTYNLAMAGDALNTNLILGASTDGGFGPGSLRLVLEGDGSESGGLDGTGTLSLAAGQLPGMPVLAAIERLFQGTEVIGAGYDPFEVRFRMKGDRLEIDPFEVLAGQLRFELSGSVGFEGPLKLHTSLRAPRGGIEVAEIPDEILEALTDADGNLNLPILIGGSQEVPSVEFDRSGWSRMAKKRVEAEVKKEIGRQLLKLFSNDDEDDDG